MKHFIYFTLVSSVLFTLGCAKNRDVERLRADQKYDHVLKAAFTGKGEVRDSWYFKITVKNVSSNGGFLFTGNQGDLKVGYFDFTENKLLFKSVSGVYDGKETTNSKNNVELQWPVTHHDYRLDQRDGLTTNQEIEDNFKVWNEKKFFKINFGSPDINEKALMPFTLDAAEVGECWIPVSRRKVDDSFKIEEDHIGFVMEVVYQQNTLCANNLEHVANGSYTFTAQYKYSFRKVKPSDYKPMYFEGELDPNRYKYGYFQTVREVLDKTNGRPKNIFMANRWHPEKTHHYYFTKGFPEQYKWIYRNIFEKTNNLLASNGSKMRFDVNDYNFNHESGKNDGPERDFGDLRYSFFNFIEEIEPDAPLGYGPTDADPFTGEIIAGNVMVWTSGLGYYLERLDEFTKTGTISGKESSLMKQLKLALNEKTLDNYVSDWDQNKSIGKLFHEMAHNTRYGIGWNSYTWDAQKSPALVLVDKYSDGVTSLNGKNSFVTNITSILDLKVSSKLFSTISENGKDKLVVKTPFNIDMEWLENMQKSSNPELQALVNRKEMRNFISILSNVTQDAKGQSLGLKDLVQREFNSFQREVEMQQKGHCKLDLMKYMAGAPEFFAKSKLDLSEAGRKDLINTILYRVSIHEFGHNLNLRHNFYGSVDKANFTASGDDLVKKDENLNPIAGGAPRVQVSSSVMDYLRLEHEYNSPWAWEDYDKAAILNAYIPGYDDHGHRYLFCTDEHTATSALCNRFDFGTTPSQILMSIIQGYDDAYPIRNKRFGRAFWDTRGYAGGVLTTMREIKEFLAMWRSAFSADILNAELEKQGIVNANEQKAYVEEMNREMRNVMKLSMAFYQAVMQQSRGDRDYRSVFDETTGALKQIGIMYDKIFAMYMLADDASILYHPNRIQLHTSYLTYSREPNLGAFTDRVWRNIVTERNIAMEPWFINLARFLYAKNATDYFNRDDSSLINSMKVVRFTAKDLDFHFGLVMDSSLPAMRTTLTKSTSAAFKAGDDVVIVFAQGDYFMTKVSEGQVTFALFQDALDKLKGSGDDKDSIQQFNMDVLELYHLYNMASAGQLQ